MYKELKSAVFAVLLITASYFFGDVCERIGQGYELILFPSGEVLGLALRFFLAMGAVGLTAGLVAALVRPLWACFIVFSLSALAMLLGWELKATSGVLASVYFIASAIYAQGIAKGLEERLNFSVRPISESQSILLMALIIVACGSLYLGYAAHIEEAGFSIPPSLTDAIMEGVEREIEKRVPEAGSEEALAEFKEGFEKGLEEFVEKTIRPYERFIPLAIALSLFTSLVTITRFLSWIPVLALRVIFPLLTALGVTNVVTETREVKRLTLG